SVAAFIGAVSGVLLVSLDLPVYVGTLLCLIIGAIIGAWQGFWVAYVNIPSFIVTLAGMLIFRGLTLVVLQGRTIAPFPDSFRGLSSNFVPDIFNGGNVHLLTVLIGILVTIILVWNEVKIRKTDIRYNFQTTPLSLFIFKLVIFIAI